MVRTDMRRDMAGVLEISVPQERVDVGHLGGNIFITGAYSPREPGSQGQE
jgi:hypothetical protein